MSCEFAHHDGSYVLGALAPAERHEFEKHLTGCDDCARSVRELAGLPGLLAKVDPEVLGSPPAGEPVPDTLLPALVNEVRRARRRRTLVTVGVAAAAAVAVAFGSLAVTGAPERGPSASPASSATPTVSAGRPMASVGPPGIRGNLVLTSVAWGTRLELVCSYALHTDEYETRGQTRGPASYALLVHTRDGRVEQVATWRSLPGRTMRLAAATSARREDITSVEVRTAQGRPVLQLTA